LRLARLASVERSKAYSNQPCHYSGDGAPARETVFVRSNTSTGRPRTFAISRTVGSHFCSAVFFIRCFNLTSSSGNILSSSSLSYSSFSAKTCPPAIVWATRKFPARVGPARSIVVPVVPLPYVNTVLHFNHADLLSSHFGLAKTLDKVRRHGYWPGWRKYVKEYLRECRKCGGGKGPRPWTSGRMQRMPVTDLMGPFSLLVVDAVGSLPETEKGNKYILVFVDYFTRWAETFAVSGLDSVTFFDTMINGVVARHGVPARLLSDNGGNFSSDIAKSFYQILGIKKLFGAAYHPQTQGLVERFNGTLIGMLWMHVDKSQSDWDVYLPRVLFAYRTAYHEALGDTPFFRSTDGMPRFSWTWPSST
jgi:hypothetical protein